MARWRPLRASWTWWLTLTILSIAVFGGWVSISQARRRTDRQVRAHRSLAQVAASQGRWSLAADELRALLKLDPQSHDDWMMLADIESRQGHLDEAIRSIARVPSRSSRGLAARLLEGRLLLIKGQASRAEVIFNECLA